MCYRPCDFQTVRRSFDVFYQMNVTNETPKEELEEVGEGLTDFI